MTVAKEIEDETFFKVSGGFFPFFARAWYHHAQKIMSESITGNHSEDVRDGRTEGRTVIIFQDPEAASRWRICPRFSVSSVQQSPLTAIGNCSDYWTGSDGLVFTGLTGRSGTFSSILDFRFFYFDLRFRPCSTHYGNFAAAHSPCI